MTTAKKQDLAPDLTGEAPVNGILMIGDPHVWSRVPGRRLEKRHYPVVLRKMAHAAKIANERRLLPIILGDLVHQSNDSDLTMIAELMDTLHRFWRTPWTMVGNHDLVETRLTAGSTLQVLAEGGCVVPMTENGPFGFVDLTSPEGECVRVLVGGTPYGQEIPVSLAKWLNRAGRKTHEQLKQAVGADKVLWITHEDLAFDHAYPNARALHPIPGVDAVVNGHMHRIQKPQAHGDTVWYNPGNINRLTIDLKDQPPRCWIWTPWAETTMVTGDGTHVAALEPVDLPHQPGDEVFSLEGVVHTHAPALSVIEPEEETLEDNIDERSQFVSLIKDDTRTRRTDEGAFLKTMTEEAMEELEVDEYTERTVRALLKEALA